MDSLITVMNKLQDVFSTVGTSQYKIDLPQIVVLGSQSSGKSSVLESLVGKSFLPRGIGIITRAPLVLHLINPSESEIADSGTSEDWATFLHKPNVVFHDFGQVRREIEIRTEELAGERKNVTDQPIVLSVYSRLLYNLSFVDLPGLTKVPVGDQPEDIEEKIKILVLRFIQNPNSIILAVVTANTDPATSESLQLAKSVDPMGDRTIAVVTKIDIMDKGTDATELLSGGVIPVKLGIIGVINRSQKDINERKTIEQSLRAEADFFRTTYPSIAKEHGTVVLGKRLQTLLIKKIKNAFPGLRKQLYEMNSQHGMRVKQLQEFTNNYDRSLLDLIARTATNYCACLDGPADNASFLTELNAGANIAKYFKTTLIEDIEVIDPLHGLTPDAVVKLIVNSAGTSTGVFMPSHAFDRLVKRQLRLMEAPALTCVGFVHEELMTNVYRLDDEIDQELKKYPRLVEKIVELLRELLCKYKQKTLDAVSRLIRYQEAFVNTGHPDFIEAIVDSDEYRELFRKSVTAVDKENEHADDVYYAEEETTPPKSEYPNGRSWSRDVTLRARRTVEKITTCAFSGLADSDELILQSRAELLTLFLRCYFNVIKKIVQDTVPKTIMCEMVNEIKQNFQKHLTARVYKSNDINMVDLLTESPEIVSERNIANDRFAASEKALKLIRDIEQLCHESD